MENAIMIAAQRAAALQALIQAIVHLEDAEVINGDRQVAAVEVVKELMFLYEEEINRLHRIGIVSASVKTIDKPLISLLLDAAEKISSARALSKAMGDMCLNLEGSADTQETFFNLAYILLDTTKAIAKNLNMLAIA